MPSGEVSQFFVDALTSNFSGELAQVKQITLDVLGGGHPNLFFDDFAGEPAGSTPDHWTEYYQAANMIPYIRDEVGVAAHKSMEVVCMTVFEYYYFLYFNDAGTPTDVEILTGLNPEYEGDPDGDNVPSRVYARWTGTTTRNAYFADFYDAGFTGHDYRKGQFRVGKIVNNTFTTLDYIDYGFERGEAWVGTESRRWHWIRFQVSGESLKAKVWRETEEEPVDWDIETTDSDVTGAGYVGLGMYGKQQDFRCQFFSVSTDPNEYSPIEPEGEIQYPCVNQHIVEVALTGSSLCTVTQHAVEVIRNVENYKPIGGSQPVVVIISS